MNDLNLKRSNCGKVIEDSNICDRNADYSWNNDCSKEGIIMEANLFDIVVLPKIVEKARSVNLSGDPAQDLNTVIGMMATSLKFIRDYDLTKEQSQTLANVSLAAMKDIGLEV